MIECSNCGEPLTPGNRAYCGECGGWDEVDPPDEDLERAKGIMPKDAVLEWLENQEVGFSLDLARALDWLIARRRRELEQEGE